MVFIEWARGKATHAWQAQSEIPDQDGHGGLRSTRGGRGSLPGRVCSSDVIVQATQWRRNSGRGPHLFKKC